MKLTLVINKVIFILCTIIWLHIPKVYSQEKRILTIDDYKLWNTLNNAKITDDNNWVSYHLSYPDDKDTLFLKNVSNSFVNAYPSGKGENFSQNSKWFGCLKDEGLQLLELNSNKKYYFNNISNFSFTADGNYLIGYNSNKEENGNILLLDLNTLHIDMITGVVESSLDPSNNILAILTKENGITLIKTLLFKSKYTTNILVKNSSSSTTYMGLIWNKSSTNLAFYEKQTENYENQKIKVYNCQNVINHPIIKILDTSNVIGFPNNSYIESSRQLYISDDGKQVFIYIKKKNDSNLVSSDYKDSIQIWRTGDKTVPPAIKPKPLNLQWFVWWCDKNKMMAIDDDEYPNIVLTGDQKKALVFKSGEYLPQHIYVDDYIDLYIKDLNSGKTKLIVQKQNYEYRTTLISPGGKYITYFKDKNWWIYDIYKDTHKCLTEGLNVPFEDIDYDYAGIKPPYGNPGWIEGDSQLYIYDQFDIWQMSPDGSKRVKITDGRQDKTTYRFYNNGYQIVVRDSYFGFVADSYNSKKGILINTVNENLQQGFCYWSRKFGLKKLMQKDSNLYPLNDPGYKMPFLFLESDFNTSPRLMLLNSSFEEKLIFQSNPQQENYYWGKSELIKYEANGKELKGALIYPAGYISGKKYPMIVHIYQKQAQKMLHMYEAPSDKSSDGFNHTNFSADGYFVFYPDIAFEVNNPAISATECVIKAVEKVLEKNDVDKKRIGLIGFSFGGYEATFIIGQTNLFKTAVAGAPATDIVDFYLSLGGYGKSNIWRFESQQFRIQSPFYGEDFKNNSPLTYVQNINTPLLLYTGTQDPQIEWTHSRKLQIALWRLNKESTLLVYPGEGHGFIKEVNQRDITRRVKNWFDYYLKSCKKADWLE